MFDITVDLLTLLLTLTLTLTLTSSECLCEPMGTAVVNNVTNPTCDLVTGQCNCARPGIVGRTCDRCAPVSTLHFNYVELFYIGAYPNCVLCGECFDSWATLIDEIGADLQQDNQTLRYVWDKYGTWGRVRYVGTSTVHGVKCRVVIVGADH